MGLRELVILVLILAIVGVILRGLYVALKARRGQLRMALEKNIPQYDPEELSLSELPNGGARMVERSFAQVVRQNSEFSSRDRLHKGRSEQAIPVLMDTVTDDYDDKGVGSARTAPSAVAGARQAARQRHGIKPSSARPPQKPTHRPIDRMADRMAELQQSAATAVTTVAEPTLYETPIQVAPQPSFADPLDSHVFRDDEVEEPRYDAPAFESPSLAAAAAEDDYDDVEQRYEARSDEQYPEDDEDDYDDELEEDEGFSEFDDKAQAEPEQDLDDDDDDDEYQAESFESVYADDVDDDYDDDQEADDENDEVDDPLASRFEDDLDDDEEDEEFAEEAEEYHYETDFADDQEPDDQDDDYYEDDEEDEVVEQKTGPRRWLQWAGEKLSGMTAAAASEGERVREKAAEEQARARAEMTDRAAKAASKADRKADSKAETKGRTERAEPIFGAASFDDALLDDDQDYQDRRAFNEPARAKLDAQSRARPAPTEGAAPRKKLESLDRSRQSELNLDEPEDLRADSRTELRAEPRVESRAESKNPSKEQQPEADAVPEYSEVLVINVVAKPEREFTGVDLLPVLLTSGLRFGDMSIFHRHIEADSRSPVLFSVANIVNPGTFDLNQINDFATRGLCFFMTLPNVANSMQAFDKMLDVAQQVRIALDGDLKDDNRSVMTAQTIEHYRQRVRDFDLRQLRQHK
ncbi:MAG: cell division protein ZipA [Gammaproteobacteria bacterium]|nr:cell division protein ZipA [Gammaproteobacteria bacterium]